MPNLRTNPAIVAGYDQEWLKQEQVRDKARSTQLQLQDSIRAHCPVQPGDLVQDNGPEMLVKEVHRDFYFHHWKLVCAYLRQDGREDRKRHTILIEFSSLNPNGLHLVKKGPNHE